MTEYRCRFCGWFLFSTSQPFGRIWVPCKNRRCEGRRGQWVDYRPARVAVGCTA